MVRTGITKTAVISLVGGAFATAAVAAMPTAGATCFSLFGLGSGGQCTSTPGSIAVAIGTNAEAHADGFLGAAFAVGNFSSATTESGALMNFAITFGDSNFTSAGGIASVAFAANGINQAVIAGAGGLGSGSVGNIAVSVAGPQATQTVAAGIANVSVNLAGAGDIVGTGVGLTTVNAVGLGASLENVGTLNNITNLAGNNITITNNVGNGGLGNFAFNVIGEDNVISTRGALAVAGAFGSVGQTVAQDGPGVNVSFIRQSATRASARAAAEPRDPGGAKPTATRSRGGR